MEKNAGKPPDPRTRRYAETAASAFPRRNACLLLRLYSSLASSFVACHASTIASSVSYGRTNARPRSSASGVNPKSVAASTDPSARSSPSRFARRARARGEGAATRRLRLGLRLARGRFARRGIAGRVRGRGRGRGRAASLAPRLARRGGGGVLPSALFVVNVVNVIVPGRLRALVALGVAAAPIPAEETERPPAPLVHDEAPEAEVLVHVHGRALRLVPPAERVGGERPVHAPPDRREVPALYERVRDVVHRRGRRGRRRLLPRAFPALRHRANRGEPREPGEGASELPEE